MSAMGVGLLEEKAEALRCSTVLHVEGVEEFCHIMRHLNVVDLDLRY
jgi:hypothetical protein